MAENGGDVENLHAGCVAWRGRGLLILGAAGAGKSALALDLIALGATLVSDDRTLVRRVGATLHAEAPAALAGMIEARGIGLLRLPFRRRAALALAIDLDRCETSRLPHRQALRLRELALPLMVRPEPLRPAAILAALRFGPPLDVDQD